MPLSTIDTSSISGLGYGFKNRLINGGMAIDQRNNGASFTNSNAATYGLDRWKTYGLTSALFTIQQSTTAPQGFKNSQLWTTTTSTTAFDSGGITQLIEGNNASDLDWGTASGSSVALSFWARSSVTGTYNVYFRYVGSTATYYYIATYTINSANTWEQKSIVVPAAPAGAGAFTAALNTTYMEVRFVFASSGDTNYATPNTWSSTGYVRTSGSVNLASTSGATFYVTGVQLEKGTVATSFDWRPYGTELQLCQRYYWKNDSTANFAALASGLAQSTTSARVYMKYPAEMRTQPSMSYNGTIVVNDSTDRNITAIGAAYTSTSSVMLDLTVTTVLTVGRGVVVYKGNTSSDYIQASAEL